MKVYKVIDIYDKRHPWYTYPLEKCGLFRVGISSLQSRFKNLRR